MPLLKSGSRAAIGTNISEMEAAGHPRNQAIAAAMSTARKYGMATGGAAYKAPSGERLAQRQVMHEGFLHSTVPGRTDKLPISVSGGAYVLPADHIAALGQGNSLAGANIVNKMFKMGPAGSQLATLHGMRTPTPKLSMKTKFARGGGHGQATPIIAAGGEVVLPPDKIIERFGDLDKGHKALDHWVVSTRKQHVKTLRGLKPPRKD